MPRYVLPPDLPSDVRDFAAVMLPVSWGIVRALRDGPDLTLQQLRELLRADPRTVTKRLDALEAVNIVHVLPDDVEPDDRQGHLLSYRLDTARFDALHTAWMAYVRTPGPGPGT